MQHEKALFRFGGDRAHEQRCRLRELHACGCIGQAKSSCLQPRFLCPSSSSPTGAGGRVAPRLRINLDMLPPRALPAAHFDRNESYAYFGDRTLLRLEHTGVSLDNAPAVREFMPG